MLPGQPPNTPIRPNQAIMTPFTHSLCVLGKATTVPGLRFHFTSDKQRVVPLRVEYFQPIVTCKGLAALDWPASLAALPAGLPTRKERPGRKRGVTMASQSWRTWGSELSRSIAKRRVT